MRRHTIVLLAAGAVAILAAAALAGWFWNNGRVLPPWGYGDSTEFTWSVEYQLSDEQEVPNCYLKVFDGEWQIGRYMMGVTQVDVGIVYYSYKMTLSTGDQYTYQFVTFDDSTLVQFGPTVYQADRSAARGSRSLAALTGFFKIIS